VDADNTSTDKFIVVCLEFPASKVL